MGVEFLLFGFDEFVKEHAPQQSAPEDDLSSSRAQSSFNASVADDTHIGILCPAFNLKASLPSNQGILRSALVWMP